MKYKTLDVDLLRYIHSRNELREYPTVREMATYLGVTSATIYKHLTRLQINEYITRGRGVFNSNKRVVTQITPDGKEVLFKEFM